LSPAHFAAARVKALLAWAIDAAKQLGATRLTIEADPDAATLRNGRAVAENDGLLRI